MATLPAGITKLLQKVPVIGDAAGGHDGDEEHSAVLVAAPVSAPVFPGTVSSYRAFEYYTAAHEGTLVDESAYLVDTQPTAPGSHLRVFLSLSKHGTYDEDPDFLPLLEKVGIAALITVAATEKDPVKAAELVAAIVLVFFVIIVERFTPTVTTPPSGPRFVNVGELGRELNGATWIEEARPLGRDLVSKFTDPLWTIDRPLQPQTATLQFLPGVGTPGTIVSIVGTELASPVASVKLGGVAAAFERVVPGLVRVTVPPNAKTGPIELLTCSGLIVRSARPFEVCPDGAPLVGAFVPSEGVEGDQIEITGDNFATTSSVTIGGMAAPFIVNSPHSITAFVPMLGVGTSSVTVTTARGADSLGGFKLLRVTNNAVLTAFHPPIAGPGQPVTVFGAFPTAPSSVTIGGRNAPFVVGAPRTRNQVTVTVPSGIERGLVEIDGGSGPSSLSELVIAPDAQMPAIERFAPTAGVSTPHDGVGTDVRFIGFNLGLNTVGNDLRFGGELAQRLVFDSQLTFTVTAHTPSTGGAPIDARISIKTLVVTEAGFIFADNDPVNRPAPTITGISGALTPGARMTIEGQQLLGAVMVTFGGIEACFSSVLNANRTVTQLSATVPAAYAGGPVQVFTPYGTAQRG